MKNVSLKTHKIRPIIYENIEQLSYGELLTAINNIKKQLLEIDNKDDNKDLYNHQSNYYNLLVAELDKRQTFIE